MISIIVAVAKNGVIGADGKIPWRLPEDLARFKELTMGQVIIMGRKTYESIGRPLPGRHTIIISRSAFADRGFVAPCHDSVTVVQSLSSALVVADSLRNYPGCKKFICGGADVYREALSIADHMYLTRVFSKPIGDTFFPLDFSSNWTPVSGPPRIMLDDILRDLAAGKRAVASAVPMPEPGDGKIQFWFEEWRRTR